MLVGLLAKHSYGITHVIEGMERSSEQYSEAYERVKTDCASLIASAGERDVVEPGQGYGPQSMGTKAVQSTHFNSLRELYAASRRNMASYREQILNVLVARANESGGTEVKLLGPVLKGLVRSVEKIDKSYDGDFRCTRPPNNLLFSAFAVPLSTTAPDWYRQYLIPRTRYC